MGWWVGGERCREEPPHHIPGRRKWGESQRPWLLRLQRSHGDAGLSPCLGLLICDTGLKTAPLHASWQDYRGCAT